MKKHFLLLLSLVSLTTISFAQIPELNVRNTNISMRASGIAKARNYYNNGDYIRAEAMLYSELEKGNFRPNDFLLFANTLNADNKASLALEFFKEYVRVSDNKNATLQIESIFSETKTSYVSRLLETDFPISNPTMYDERVYSSTGGRLLSYGTDCDGNLSNRKEVLQDVVDRPIGSVAFFDYQTKAVISLIDNNQSSLYLIYQKKGKWKKPIKLFTDKPGNYAFPFIDEVNNTLYFSSDRSNGFGGYDIYISSIMDKSFSPPINMGNEINSSGNEINPTVTNDWLYLSSNGHISKGGYDLFKYKNLGDFNVIFANCTDLNTRDNDLGLVPNGKNQFLVTRGNNDVISLYSLSKPAVASTFSGNVIDDNGNPLQNAFVLINSKNNIGNYSTTSSTGKFIHKSGQVTSNISGIVMADGYETSSFDATSDQSVTIRLIKIKPIEIIKEVEIIVYSNDTSATEVTETIIPDTLFERESSSTQPDRGLYYIIIGSTYNYAQAYDYWNEWISSFSGAEILEYDNGLYRIGFYGGKDEDQVLSLFNEARKLKNDVWILRPEN
ncbi:MAG: hypothetical protein COA58_02710 [Bacteroidetes bacterium]|nr:MAG: hypothetical protein COA58_02710 [Bacteroidota bacterium]